MWANKNCFQIMNHFLLLIWIGKDTKLLSEHENQPFDSSSTPFTVFLRLNCLFILLVF